jgi:two-component system invasion response regulator UvrY
MIDSTRPGPGSRPEEVRPSAAVRFGADPGPPTSRRTGRFAVEPNSGPGGILMHGQRQVRVGLVEDHHLVREGLRLVLAARGIDVVAETPTAAGIFEVIRREALDIILLDLSLGGTDGITVLRELQARAPEIAVIVLTMHRDPETVRQALRAGAAGYVVKGAHSSELYDAIAAVTRGERYLHSSIARIVVDDSLRWLASDTVLTPREREIVGLLASGARPAEMGVRLGISTHTVRRHIANLSAKLGTHGIRGLVDYAIREGLVREPSVSD